MRFQLPIVVGFLAVASSLFAGSSLTDAIARLESDVEAARERLRETRARIAKERTEARTALTEADAAVRKSTEGLSEARKGLEGKRGALDDLRLANRKRLAQAEESLSALREIRKQAGALMERGFSVPKGLPDLDATLSTDASLPSLPKLAEALFAVLEDEVASASEVATEPTSLLLADGRRCGGRMVRIGSVSACFVSDDGKHVGLVHRQPGTPTPRLVERGLSRSERRVIRDAVSAHGAATLVDLTQGWALARLQEQKTLWETAVAGGPVMIAIGLVASLGLLLAVERLVFLGRVDVNVDALLEETAPALSEGRYEEAEGMCVRRGGPIARVVSAGVSHERGGGQHLEDVLEEAILAELPTLERGLATLAVFAAVAPLLGLLGTVTGMIETFRAITVHGAGDPRILSAGISEALITTEAGLIVAVPLLLVHTWLARRVRKIVAHMERGSMALANTLRAHGKQR